MKKKPKRYNPLATPAWEVLCSLALNMRLEEGRRGWAFVGPFQVPEESGVSPSTVDELLSAGFVKSEGGRCVATPAGLAEVESRIIEGWRTALLSNRG